MRSASRGTVIDVPQDTHTQMMMSVRSVVFWSWSIPQIGHAGRISQGVLRSLEPEDKRWTPGRVYDDPRRPPCSSAGVNNSARNRVSLHPSALVRDLYHYRA
jgi:hypothetical protein